LPLAGPEEKVILRTSCRQTVQLKNKVRKL